MQEVLLTGIFIQPPHQVGNGAVKVFLQNHGGIKEQTVRRLADDPRLMVRHPFQHFEFHLVTHAFPLTQQHGITQIKQVVGSHAELHISGIIRHAAVMEHSLVIGIHLGFRAIWGLRPAMHGGLHLLHRQVGAFHQAYFDARSPLLHAFLRPGAQLHLLLPGIRQIGLEHNSRLQMHEFILHQRTFERFRRQMKITVFLHIQIHELGLSGTVRQRHRIGNGRPIQDAQALLNQFDGFFKGYQMNLAENG